MNWNNKKRLYSFTFIKKILRYIAWSMILFVFLFPVAWIFLNSVKPKIEQMAIPLVWVTTNPTLENYSALFSMERTIRAFSNSITVTFLTLISVLILALPFAYTFSRFKTGGRPLLISLMFVRFLPPVSYVIPFFIITRKYGLYDTQLSLVMINTFFRLPITIWLMIGFFSEIPVELDEAAMIDGCTRLGAVFRVVLPLIIPGLVGVSVLTLIIVWNEFLMALVLTASKARTLPVLINNFVTGRTVEWGVMCSAGVLSALPMIVIGLLAQKYLVKGWVAGAIK